MTKKLEEYSREELIEEIKALKRRKKFGLVWEDKKEDIVEKCKNEIPVLKEVPELAINEKPGGPTNLIIEGDNFASLQVLNYTHHGKIDVIYIDPPYNTGNKDFIYNDSYVDSEDSFRHSKWLSFMDRRLRLARELLSDDGVMFISIDDNEQPMLSLLLRKIFNESQIEQYIWCLQDKTEGSFVKTAGLTVRKEHEYVIACFNGGKRFKKYKSLESKNGSFSNPDNDPRGDWFSGNMSRNGIKTTTGSKYYTITNPAGISFTRNWTLSKDEYEQALRDGRIFFSKNGEGVPRIKVYKNDDNFQIQSSLLTDVHTSVTGKNSLKEIFNKSETPFDFPKPTTLIERLIEISSDKNAFVLDFFAGSGTTGQAVLELNKQDGGNRKFILCTNNESNIARDITFPRIKTVVTGIRPDGSKYSDGISANVRYFTTDFIEKGSTGDATRAKLFEKSDEMIQVRENAFEFVDKNDNYTFYKNNEKFVAIIKDPFNFGPIWYELEEKNTEKLPVILYVFSYSNYTFEDEIPDTDLKYEICAIPNSIMEVYRKISDKKEER